MKARLSFEMLARHYEAASTGRRTQNWKKPSSDANAAVSGGLSSLRAIARDLVRNNPHAESAISTIADHTVGWGIVPTPNPENARAAAVWKEWADTTDCDADGRHDFSGLQKLAMRTVVEAGEVLVRRRLRFPDDGLPIPMQIQVLEPDYLDTAKTIERLPGGGRILYGVEFNAIGRRVAYWLFPEHPGASLSSFSNSSVRVRAENVIHVYRQTRPGQVRGISWFAPVVLRIKNFDEYEDAQLEKQKIAACTAVITSDPDGSSTPLGQTTADQPEVDMLEPGSILNILPGRTVDIVQPPRVGEYGSYASVTLRGIAAGLGVTYEDMTGDYTNLPFSAARMSRLRHWARVLDWRWQTLIPQLCRPTWRWAMESAAIMNLVSDDPLPTADWTAPPAPMIDPDKEGLAYQRLIRSGLSSLSEVLRERGYDPKVVLNELAGDFKQLDALGLLLDSDPRNMTQAGQIQSVAEAPEEDADDEDEDMMDDEEDNDETARIAGWLSKLPARQLKSLLGQIGSRPNGGN
jgi:lambda family phage portal protein